MRLPYRPFAFASVTVLAVATGACNAIFGITPGIATGGTGGAGATGSSTGGTASAGTGASAASSASAGSGGTTSSTGAGGGTPCTNKGKATCSGPSLEVCDETGHTLAPQTCAAASLCDAVALKCNDFPRIAVGLANGCALSDDQSVRCWGFGDGSLVVTDARLWIPIAEKTGVSGRQIAVGAGTACALQDDGTAACWGWDGDGALGVAGTGNNQIVNPVPTLPPAVELAATSRCSCARLAGGTVDCWGTQDDGCLGTASQTTGVQYQPTQVGTFTDAVEIRAGGGDPPTVCARQASGQVTCWGPTVEPTPVSPGMTDATDVAIGNGIIFVQRTSGLYWTKASGSGWQALTALANPLPFTQISAGKALCGIQSNGSAIACTSLYAGNTPPPALTAMKGLPTGTVADLAVGFGDSDQGTLQCLRLAGASITGNVYCWGDDAFGALGAGGPEYFKTPAPVTTLPAASATSISTADASSSAVVQGQVWAWGGTETYADSGDPMTPFLVQNLGNANASVRSNDEDGLGYAFPVGAPPPVLFEYGTAVQGAPERLLTSAFTDFVDAQMLSNFDVGLRAGGQVVVWPGTADADDDGIFGDGAHASVTVGTSVTVPLGANAASLAVFCGGYESDPAHACAILASGAVSCWGNNLFGSSGVPGVGAPPGAPPTPVLPNVLTFPAGAKSMVSVAVGQYFSCATDGFGTANAPSGKVYCWGSNGNGALGVGMTTDFSDAVPTAVQGITNALGVAAGPAFACAWRADGSVACWGQNDFAQLGNGDATFTDMTTPTKVAFPTGTTAVVRVSIAADHACALHAAGTVSCWGSSYFGQVGTGVTGFFDTPLQALGL